MNERTHHPDLTPSELIEQDFDSAEWTYRADYKNLHRHYLSCQILWAKPVSYPVEGFAVCELGDLKFDISTNDGKRFTVRHKGEIITGPMPVSQSVGESTILDALR